MRLTILSPLLFILALAACTPTVVSRGYLLDSDKLAEVKIGTSTREDVATKLGTPTQTGTFDDKVWYYIGRQTEQYSFFDPKVTKQKAIRVTFNDEGVVTALTDLNLDQSQDIASVERATPTYGNDNTFIKQLLGNLSHPTPNMGTTKGR